MFLNVVFCPSLRTLTLKNDRVFKFVWTVLTHFFSERQHRSRKISFVHKNFVRSQKFRLFTKISFVHKHFVRSHTLRLFTNIMFVHKHFVRLQKRCPSLSISNSLKSVPDPLSALSYVENIVWTPRQGTKVT